MKGRTPPPFFRRGAERRRPGVRHGHLATPAAACTTKKSVDELSKTSRVVHKACGTASVETLLVLDAITGQNAISQASQFIDAAGATGIVLTKLDGTAKGGAVISIKAKLGLPVRFVGVGEGMDDLMEFDPDAFVDALFLREE